MPAILDERNGHFFAIYDNEMNQADAVKKCQRVGATLPIIKNQPVKDAVNYYNSKSISCP